MKNNGDMNVCENESFLVWVKKNDLLVLFWFLFLNKCIMQIGLRGFLGCSGQILTQWSKKLVIGEAEKALLYYDTLETHWIQTVLCCFSLALLSAPAHSLF